jgi:hypothetical protein
MRGRVVAATHPTDALVVDHLDRFFGLPTAMYDRHPRALIVIGHDGADACAPPGDAVAVYELIAAPPLSDGAVQLTVACPSATTAETFVGAPGGDGPPPPGDGAGALGVTAVDGADALPVPTPFVAFTVNV